MGSGYVDSDDIKTAINVGIGVAVMLAAVIGAIAFIFWLPSFGDEAATWYTTTTTSTTTTTVATTTTTVPTSTVPSTTSTVMPVDEHDATQVDHAPILAAARVFAVGWLAPATPAERSAWLEPVTSARLLPLVADIPAEVLPKGQLGDLVVVYADEYRAVVHAPVTNPETGETLTAALSLQPTARVTLPEAAGWMVHLLDEA